MGTALAIDIRTSMDACSRPNFDNAFGVADRTLHDCQNHAQPDFQAGVARDRHRDAGADDRGVTGFMAGTNTSRRMVLWLPGSQ
jgi:hypothetical protein